MADYAIISSQTLHGIADAIIAKGGATKSMPARAMSDKIRNIPQSPVWEYRPAPVTDVLNFYDYDGTLLYVYNKAQVKSAGFGMPPLPSTRDGVTYVGWSHDLEGVKIAGSVEAPCLDVMPVCEMAAGSDGLAPTKLYMRLADPGITTGSAYRGTVKLVFTFKEGSGFAVDWGDGSESVLIQYSTEAVEVSHDYFSGQGFTPLENIVISVFPSSDTVVRLGSGSGNMFPTTESDSGVNYPSAAEIQLVAAEIGGGVELVSQCFMNCSNLRSVLLPASVGPLPDSVFSGCSALQAVLVQKEHFASGAGSSQFSDCSGLKTLVLCPDVDAVPANSFSGCTGLENIVVPGSVEGNLGSGAFACASGSRPRLCNLGICQGVTRIPFRAFANIIRSVMSIRLPESVTYIDYEAFSGVTNVNGTAVSLTKVIDLSLPTKVHHVTVVVAGEQTLIGPYKYVAYPPGFKLVLYTDKINPAEGGGELLDWITYGDFWDKYVERLSGT